MAFPAENGQQQQQVVESAPVESDVEQQETGDLEGSESRYYGRGEDFLIRKFKFFNF